mgnify:CR=1 FL=1
MINKDLNYIKELLLKDNHSIVILKKDASIVTSDDRGVFPLINLLEEDQLQLQDSIIADKVIGKAAALLMIYGGVKEVYSPVISTPAIKVFYSHNVNIYYDKEVERIINRKGDGLCPMETLCIDIDNPSDAFDIISRKRNK